VQAHIRIPFRNLQSIASVVAERNDRFSEKIKPNPTDPATDPAKQEGGYR
jgi:hypothetical protein